MIASSASRSKLALVGVIFALSIHYNHQASADAFPSLFSRSPLFKRTNQPAVAAAPTSGTNKQQKDQLVPLANSFAPMQFNVASSSGPQHELMRLTNQPQQATTTTANGQQISAHQLMRPNAAFHLMDSAAAYYKPNVVHVSHPQQHQSSYDEQPLMVDSALESMHHNYQQHQHHQQPKYQINQNQYYGQQGLRNEPSHTSEVVDKIEQHIGQQIEQSLNEQPAMGGYHHQRTASSSSSSSSSEKEAAASGSSEAEAAEPEEGSSSGGGESEEGSSAAAKPEKREHKEHEESAAAHHHHEEKKEDHPPEAFEVHHKKGGKSFQYFHQGHHSS